MRLVGYLFVALCCAVVNASAQTFSGNAGVSAATPQPQQVQETAPAPAPISAAKAESEEIIKDAVVNISGSEKESEQPVYDNSVPKVVSFKIIKGKVIFDDDKDRKILISSDNFSVSKGMDNIVRCKMRIFVLNDMTERLNSLGFKLIWPEISTAINLVKVNPGVRTYRDIMLLGDGCFSMDKNPTVEVNRCRVKGKSEEECANAVKWFRHTKK